MQTRTHHEHGPSGAEGEFSRDGAGLPECVSTEIVELSDGGVFDLRLAPVVKRIGDVAVRMLAYNGSIPGPTLKVRQDSEITVNVTNEADLETTVHWHGLRLQNSYDGVPHETQAPIPAGASFTYRLQFPDAGVFWYHPHLREDYAQDMGLSGNILVVPTDLDYWPPVNREIVLTVDDILLEDGRIAPYSRSGPSHTAMGRSGNVLLVNGETRLDLDLKRDEVVRLYLTNTANTRIFNLSIPGARMKLIGGDGGRYENEEIVDGVLIAPSERAIVDVLLQGPGHQSFRHRTPASSYLLGHLHVDEEQVRRSLVESFGCLRRAPEMVAERSRIPRDVERPPDKTLALVAEMHFGAEAGAHEADTTYSCPMHADVVSDKPERCPKCGMKLLPVDAESTHAASTPTGESSADSHASADHIGHEHHGYEEDGIEWEDMMPEVNRMTDPTNMVWKLVDRETGEENAAIDWKFRVGDQVKIRLINEMDSDHPMHHPFHVHGLRFLVLSRNDAPEPNLVWKDTVLVRTGETVDILLDASNPGLWMAHCHIAEHAESGMMFSFRVDHGPMPVGRGQAGLPT